MLGCDFGAESPTMVLSQMSMHWIGLDSEGGGPWVGKGRSYQFGVMFIGHSI